MNATLTHTIDIGDGTYIAPTHASTRVRGGGIAGGGAWVARITGTHPRFGLNRAFVPQDRNLSGSGRSGSIDWYWTGAAIIEYRDFAAASNRVRSGFAAVSEGGVREITRDEAIEWATRYEALRPAARRVADQLLADGTDPFDALSAAQNATD